MVCPMEKESIRVTVRDTILQSTTGKNTFTIQLTPSTSIDSIFREVSKEFDYSIDDIEIMLQPVGGQNSNIVSSLFFRCFLKNIKWN